MASARELAEMSARLGEMLGGKSTARLVTVTTPTGPPVYDPSLGTASVPTVEDSPRGLLQPMTLREVEAGAGAYQLGDVRLRVMASALSVPPNTDTTFTDGDHIYAVLTAQRDPLQLHWLLTGRRAP